MTRKRIAFCPAHPAQVWVLRPVAEAVAEFAEPLWILRDKDIALDLARHLGLEHVVLTRAARGLAGNALEFAAASVRATRLARRLGVDVWVSKYGPAHVAARLTGARSVAFNDDDADVVPLIAWTAYPLADLTLVTDVTRMGRFESRAVRMPSCFELGYLHPSRFEPDPGIYGDLGLEEGEPFALVRLSSLQAHHDVGARGVGADLLGEVIALAGEGIRVFVSSERPLEPALEPLRVPLAPHRIHHALAFAAFVLGDSQTMTAEAAVLGTPAFRLNSFVGRISYLEDLEARGLAFGFRPGQEAALLVGLAEVLAMVDRDQVFQDRRAVLLAQRVDPVPVFARALRRVCEGAPRERIREEVA